MQDIVEKLLNEDDESRHTVDLRVYVDGLEDGEESSYADEIELKYAIEIEQRNWGIKDIEVSMRGTVEFEVDILDVDDNVTDTIPVKFDFSEIDYQISWMKGAGYAPESLEVELSKDGKIIRVDVNFYYITKE